MTNQNRPYRRLRREPFRRNNPKPVTTEDKIRNFILRNSRNGFFTRLPTIVTKFEISEDEAWSIIGSLISDEAIESKHDGKNEQIKLCEKGKFYQLLSKEEERRSSSKHNFSKKK